MLPAYLARLLATYVSQVGKPRLDALAEVRLSMRVWPHDIDPYLHLNNGRYLSLMDFGRYQMAQRTGLLPLMLRRHWWPVIGSAVIRFRRELRLFESFTLTTRLASWQGRWFFIEQRFVRDDVVYAEAWVRGVFRERGKSISCDDVVMALGHADASPPLPDVSWLA